MPKLRLSTTEHMRRLLRNRRGAAAVEMAFVLPVFLILIFGILEFSLILFATSMLEGATREASRSGITGNAPSGVTRDEHILDIVKHNTSVMIDHARLTLTTKVYEQFDQINAPEPFEDANGNGIYDPGETFTDINGNSAWDQDMAAAGLGNAGDVVVYTVRYPWDLLTPGMGAILGQDGVITLEASIAVRNEPYNITVLN